MAESKTTKAKQEEVEKEVAEKETTKSTAKNTSTKSTAKKEKEEDNTEAAESTEVAVTDQSTDLEIGDDFDLESLGFDVEELDHLSGLESINASDIRVPYGKMYAKVQKGRKLGDIELPDGTVYEGANGEMLTELSILKIQTVRVMFPQPFSPKNTFICRSLDGKYGAEDGKYPGQPCATCEFAQYPEDGGASPCREQLLLLCTLPDKTLFYFLVSGIGVSEFKKTFMSVEMMRGLSLVKKKLKKNVLGALNITMSVQFEDTDYGEFPKPIFRVDKEKPLVNQERLVANLEAYQSYKEFEDEAVATAATFAQDEQGEHDVQDEADAGENADAF